MPEHTDLWMVKRSAKVSSMSRQEYCDPLVSILTPSFNQGRFLGDCIRSVRVQSYQSIEHIIVDGGSTDETLDVLRTLSNRVTWVSERDRGQADAVNKAFRMSRGEIIGWVNSDDAYFSVDTVSSAVRHFQRNPRVDVVFGDAATVREDGMILRHVTSYWPSTDLPREHSPICQPAVFVRRKVLDQWPAVLQEDLHVTLDYELWIRLSKAGAVFDHVSRVMAIDRDHGERKVRLLEHQFEDEVQMIEKMHGVGFARSRTTMERGRRIVRRLRGLSTAMRWSRLYEPAFAWHVDDLHNRLIRQIAMSDRRMRGAGCRSGGDVSANTPRDSIHIS